LAVLTLVENAIRHGIDPSEEGGEIDISARVEGHKVELQVADTGLGLNTSIPGAAGGGTGLAMLRERLQGHFGSEARLELSENIPRGVIARLCLPVQAECIE
jgi:LytS/YehU family sensor histidine kinase